MSLPDFTNLCHFFEQLRVRIVVETQSIRLVLTFRQTGRKTPSYMFYTEKVCGREEREVCLCVCRLCVRMGRDTRKTKTFLVWVGGAKTRVNNVADMTTLLCRMDEFNSLYHFVWSHCRFIINNKFLHYTEHNSLTVYLLLPSSVSCSSLTGNFSTSGRLYPLSFMYRYFFKSGLFCNFFSVWWETKRKVRYRSRFLRVILAQGPC